MALVGSVARGEATDDSDIDVVIHTGSPFSLTRMTQLAAFLKEKSGRKVDVVHSASVYPKHPLDALPEAVREDFLRDMVEVF